MKTFDTTDLFHLGIEAFTLMGNIRKTFSPSFAHLFDMKEVDQLVTCVEKLNEFINNIPTAAGLDLDWVKTIEEINLAYFETMSQLIDEGRGIFGKLKKLFEEEKNEGL